MYVRIDVYMYVPMCAYVYIHICMYVRVSVCVYVCVCVRGGVGNPVSGVMLALGSMVAIYVYVFVCECVCVYSLIYAYTYAYTQTMLSPVMKKHAGVKRVHTYMHAHAHPTCMHILHSTHYMHTHFLHLIF